MTLPTPKLVDLDDPLQPRSAPQDAPAGAAQREKTPRPTTPRSSQNPEAPTSETRLAEATLAQEKAVGVFARMPQSVSEVLTDVVVQLNTGRPRGGSDRITQQDVLGTLVHELRDSENTAGLLERVVAYRALIRLG